VAILGMSSLLGRAVRLVVGLPILAATTDRLVGTKWQAAILVLLVVVSRRRPDLRLVDIDDADARTCSQWLAPYLMVSPFIVFAICLCEGLGFPHDQVFAAAVTLGFASDFLQGRDVLGGTATHYACAPGGEVRRAQPVPPRAVAAAWHWLLIAGVISFLSTARISFSLGVTPG
jgi:hypothetical protein